MKKLTDLKGTAPEGFFDTKPREFWVSGINFDEYQIPEDGVCTAFLTCDDPCRSEAIHVIEYSAYKQMEDLKNLEINLANDLQKDREFLKAELAVAVEALEHYQSCHYDQQGNACYADKTADEVLAKIRGEK